MRLAAVIAILALAPGAAFAQVGAMDCERDFLGHTICKPTSQERMAQQQRDLDAFMRDTSEPPAPKRGPADSRQATLLKMNVGALLAEQKCDAALDLALKGRDIESASIVREVCAKR